MKIPVAIVALCLALFGYVSVLPAQQVHIRGLSFEIREPLEEVYIHNATEESEDVPGAKLEVKRYLNHEASRIPLKGTSLVFTTKPERASLKVPGEVLAIVKLSSTPKSLICVFVPGSGAEGSPKYRVLPVEDDIRGFPRGSLKIMNMSPLPVRIRLEDQNFDFKVGEIKVITDPPVGPNNHSGMTAYRFENNQWQRIGSGMWPHPGRVRVFQILFLNPVTKQVEMKEIRDIAVPDV